MGSQLEIRASFTLSLLVVALGCARAPAPATGSGAGEGARGAARLQLNLGAGATLDSAGYALSGPGGFSRAGTIDVSHSATLSVVIGDLPAGSGYAVSISGSSSDGAIACGGTATFDVTAHTTAAVTVHLTCHEAPRTGGVSIGGSINVCPAIDALSANPGEVLVGSLIALAASAHDADRGPSPLAYHWSATTGTLSDPAAPSPVFTCTTPGAATVTLTVSDGDATPGCADTLSAQVSCTMSEVGVVTAAALIPGSPGEPNLVAGVYRGAKVCVDANGNGRCDDGEGAATTDGDGRFALAVAALAPLIADLGTSATSSADGSTNPARTVFRASAAQALEQAGHIVLGPLSTEVVRAMEAGGADYQTEKQNLATRLSGPAAAVSAAQVLADPSTLPGAVRAALLGEANLLTGRFRYAITKLDRGDLYPDALAVPGGDPELTGLPGVSAATATVADNRRPITFLQAQQAAFNVEGIPRYDHIFVVMLENKSTQAIIGSAFAPKLNGYLRTANFASSYYATGQPSEPNYTALGGADDFGITDDAQWNCDATGPNAPQDLPLPDPTQPGLASSPFAATCTQAVGTNHNIVGKPNLFNAISAAGMTWRSYSESMNPGQDFRTDSVGDPAVVAPDNVYPPGTLAGNAAPIGNASLLLPLPAGLYKTKHHPGMAYQNVRSAPEFKYSNRTLGGGQWDGALGRSRSYAIPAGYDSDQFGSDLASGNVGALNFVIPDQCDDMHGITVKGTFAGTTTAGTASDCGSVSNNVPVATGGNIITRGDNYVDALVRKLQASALWNNPQRRVALVLMFDEGNATSDLNSCCGWKAGKTATSSPLVKNADGSWSPDTSNPSYTRGNQGHGKSIYILLTNQAGAPKGIVDNDVYSHFSFVRTLQDMFLLADPAQDASFMNRAKYTERFIAENILNLPEYAGSADTHFDSVRPMNHAYVIPGGYLEKATLDDSRPLQVGPDATQINIWALGR